MKLYVGNCTKQKQRIYYRLDFAPDGSQTQNPKFNPPRHQDIPPGRQLPLGGELQIHQIEAIVSQLNTYGMVGASEVGQLKKYAPYVFDVDKPVSARVLQAVIDVNDRVKSEEGSQRRKKAAIAANQNLVAQIAEENFRVAQDNLTMNEKPLFEVGIEQEEPGEGPSIAEGFKIEYPPAEASRHPGNRSGRSKRGR